MKSKQNSWQQTFSKVDQLTKEAKQRGEDVNLIFTKSWFRRKRHLDRFKYDRLIFFNPETRSYTTVDGINRGESYTPRTGDFLINIDRVNTDFLGEELNKYKEIYRFSPKKIRAGFTVLTDQNKQVDDSSQRPNASAVLFAPNHLDNSTKPHHK